MINCKVLNDVKAGHYFPVMSKWFIPNTFLTFRSHFCSFNNLPILHANKQSLRYHLVFPWQIMFKTVIQQGFFFLRTLLASRCECPFNEIFFLFELSTKFPLKRDMGKIDYQKVQWQKYPDSHMPLPLSIPLSLSKRWIFHRGCGK